MLIHIQQEEKWLQENQQVPWERGAMAVEEVMMKGLGLYVP